MLNFLLFLVENHLITFLWTIIEIDLPIILACFHHLFFKMFILSFTLYELVIVIWIHTFELKLDLFESTRRNILNFKEKMCHHDLHHIRRGFLDAWNQMGSLHGHVFVAFEIQLGVFYFLLCWLASIIHGYIREFQG